MRPESLPCLTEREVAAIRLRARGRASPSQARTSSRPRSSRRAPRASRKLVCARCGTRISDTAALFAQDGERVERTFSNPAGLLFEIITLTRAENVYGVGPPTTEFTWFAGYAWQVCLCAVCRAHLGWRFVAVADATPLEFWGLVKRCLLER